MPKWNGLPIELAGIGYQSKDSDGYFLFDYSSPIHQNPEKYIYSDVGTWWKPYFHNQTGNNNSETLVGGLHFDEINGLGGDDLITGGANNDILDGGSGSDTAIYSGKFNDYSVESSGDTLTITDERTFSKSGYGISGNSYTLSGQPTEVSEGTDTLKNFEFIKFEDQTIPASKVDIVKTYSESFRNYKFYNKGNGIYHIKTDLESNTYTYDYGFGSYTYHSGGGGIDPDLGYDDITGIPKLIFSDKSDGISAIVDIKGVFDQITGLNTDSGKMFRLYNAAFARFPDSDGLKYWIGKYSSGENDERVVASSFISSSEFKERYGDNVSNPKYVETLYTNVLGRDYDQEGYEYWLGQLNSGVETKYELLLGFAESAENKALFTEMTGFG